jgi:dipeptidyl aminopeptidase/acylaminoacyl peptidase
MGSPFPAPREKAVSSSGQKAIIPVMDRQTINQVAWVGDEYVQGPIRGVVLSFHGLGQTYRKSEPATIELEWARRGGLVVFPYYGPWSWMNRQARAFVDELVDSVYSAYGVPAGAPLISTGGSMGGLSSLLYTRYAKRPVAGCLALCPVCDLKAHFSERPDLPPTIHHALRGYTEDRETLFAEHSPTSQAANMPDIPYLVIHGDKDTAVSKAVHSDKFVAAMRAAGRRVEYMEESQMGHCNPQSLAVLQRQVEFVGALM